MSTKRTKILNDIISKGLQYNWHEDPYSYYKLAKEIELSYNLYEIFSSNIIDPQEDQQNNKNIYKSTNNNKDNIEAKNINSPKLYIPIIETILFENGQISGWIYNDKSGCVSKKSLKKFGTDNLIQYFLTTIKNYYVDGIQIFKHIPDNKILVDLPKFATYIVQKKETRDEKIFKKHNLEYIYEMEKIKFILIFYFSDKEPLLTDFINFYFLLNEHGGINAIKMIQNCLNCKLKLFGTSSSFNIKNSKLFNSNDNNNYSENLLRQITVKYSKPNELEQKKYFIFYEKPKISQPMFNNKILNNAFSSSNFINLFPKYKYPNSSNKYKTKNNQSKKIYIDAEPKNTFRKTYNNDIIENNIEKNKKLILEPSLSNSQEKLNKKNKINKVDINYNLDDSMEKKFKYLLKGGKKNDGKILGHMENIEEELILQNNDILTNVLSGLSEKLIKYIEKTKNMIILYAYFIFVKINKYDVGDEFYSFQKCILLYGIDKKEPPVIEKTYLLKQNMKNIIYKRIPEDVNKFKNFEKFTKNDFCHGEFCNYIVPNYFKGIKEQQLPKSSKIPKENQISIRGKNNELPGKMPLFEIKKVYDNPELTNLVLKAYSIFPPSFNKEYAIEKLIKERNKKLFQNNEAQNNNNEDEESKKVANNLSDEYGSIMDSSEKIAEKIHEYENEFKQQIIVYTPKPGKFLHVDYNDMYTEKGVCEKCYKIYTIILEFMRNIDECTAEFKSLIKAKQFLIKGENLRVNNFEEKNSNDNNLIIQEELGKMSVKKFLGIKILKLRMEELNKFKKKQKTRIERNLVTQKQELNKTFNYNLHINLKLLLANLLAEKTNNQFFNVLFNELYNEDDSVFKHLDIKKPKINFEKTNMRDLRLQMGISSLAYNPNFLSPNNMVDKSSKKSFLHNIIKNNLEKQKNDEILKNVQQQICQVDKNLFQEYNYLCRIDQENNIEDNIDSNENDINSYNIEKNKVIDEVFEYFRIPTLSRIRYLSGKKSSQNINIYSNQLNLNRNKSAKTKQMNKYLKNYKQKKTVIRKRLMPKNEERPKNIYNMIQIKSLEEIKKQKEKQLEEFLKFDPKKFHRKKKINNEENIDNKNNISISISKNNNSDSKSDSSEESENESKKSKNPLALLFEDDNWEYYDSQENSSESNAANWDKDKVVLTSLFYNKTTNEFQDINKTPYYYITTPLPKLKDFNSTQRINENPLDILRKISVGQFSSLGNFNGENSKDEDGSKFNENPKNEKSKSLLNSKNTKIYADDSFTAVPYEILDYNNIDTTAEKNNKKKNMKNNINNISNNKNDEKKYIVFVINDFFDTYVKYKSYFNLVLLKLKCYQNLSSKNDTENVDDKKNKKDIENNSLMIINSKSFKKSSHNLFIRKPINILTTKNSTISKDKEMILNTSNDKKTEKNDTNNSNNKKKEEENKSIYNNIDNKEKISELKFVLFNLPGQSTTLFTKKVTQNNIFYSDFLDRFIYYLYNEKEFDLSYKIILLGFGNGGHIALTYASLYEKYWNILDSIIMFNGYCKNGTIVNETMLEMLKLVIKENNPKTIEFFIKQSTRNPKEFNIKENEKLENKKNKNAKKNFYGFDDEYKELQKKISKINNLMDEKKYTKNKSFNKTSYKINKKIKNENYNEIEEFENNITLDGYKLITKGYFYNIQINLKEISTKILCIHSNVDSFINIHSISPLFDNDISSYRVTPLIELFNFTFKDKTSNKNSINIMINKDNTNKNEIKNKIIDLKNKDKKNSVIGYNLSNFKKKENRVRKLIIFDGSHDVSYSSDKENIICTTLISYFN